MRIRLAFSELKASPTDSGSKLLLVKIGSSAFGDEKRVDLAMLNSCLLVVLLALLALWNFSTRTLRRRIALRKLLLLIGLLGTSSYLKIWTSSYTNA
ncbi:uncharacterized protein F4812DRAFT_443754 [Daldinia caldariorum]|uniref:uncharacterized protein n=1 Tax=Daldinia caldariorum TaxID=326644 RepID=UPI0020088373|nr:uncharacterized protein F4812DRAFT_443754 [Daldinia caldariorum]KAI1464198.1 hypothetical protein F4812DRAFT_443754 [Daldinia caldariorum]